ncbi:hypothetical protein ACIRD8_07555 [Streptomyces sp. NPDC102451]|uniref:hypothetical protein n=1 Tax=Streptomyces sp. NPDC102451 TaxID=3366177 RepID=UPI003813FAE5
MDRKRIVVPVGVCAAALVGLGSWVVWQSEGPAVVVPDRVCAGALPGGPVRDLLPERGEAYEEEYLWGSYSATSVSLTWKCFLSGGGRTVEFAKFVILREEDYNAQDIARDATEPGYSPLSWGAEKGFIKGNRVSLFVGCKDSEGGPVLLEADTGVGGDDDELKDPAVQQEVVSLAADFARFMAARVDYCKAVELPDSAPVIG